MEPSQLGLGQQPMDPEEPPVPSGNELLDYDERQLLSKFFNTVNANGYPKVTKGLGGLFTEDWRLPPSLIGHNVSYGNAADAMEAMGSMDMEAMDNMFAGLQPSNLMMPASGNEDMGYHGFDFSYGDVHSQAGVFGNSSASSHRAMSQSGMSFNQAQANPTLNSRHPMAAARHQPAMPPVTYANQLPSNQYSTAQFSPDHFPSGQFSSNHFPPDQLSSRRLSSSQNPSVPLNGMPFITPTAGGQLSSGQPSSAQTSPVGPNGMPFQHPASRPYNRRPHPALNEVQFGSDPGFNSKSFVPQSQSETSDAMMRDQIATLSCLERTDSAAPTRAPSPTAWAPPQPPDAARRKSSIPLDQLGQIPYAPATSNDPTHDGAYPAMKRRRSSKTGEVKVGDDPNQTGLSAAPPAQTAAPARAAGLAANSAPRSRNRNGAGARRTPRTNLSEDQKRNNHIASEQKRRNVIKEGYPMRNALVPGLNVGGYSKSIALNLTADWIQGLVTGNEKLREAVLLNGGTLGGGGAVAVA
ncbi:hypothetical protein NEMBOFW57_009916 [Staphylotrichum longicolle]|uniref:BHLH domain-containing protein n=1 Tax=Staphylotrichum longicolle TaxID=669026 RepID=A0AAD4EQ99_9PEZI|nr:hypothetical protein NEMBOFW57_009916 [Staphylotrichum longicolle]